MFDGQFYPFQPLQFQDGVLAPVPPEAAALTMAFVAFAVSNGASITVPVAAQAGDLAVLLDFGEDGDSSAPANVIPTNWTSIVTVTRSGVLTASRGTASYRVLGVGEAGGSVTGINGSNSEAKVMFVFRPSVPLTSVTPSTWNAQSTTDNPSSQSVTASGGTPPLIVFGMAASNVTNPEFTTATPAFDQEEESANGLNNSGYKIYNDSPANHTIDMGDISNSNTLLSGYLSCA